ncbi:hypothetical protein D3C76_1053340 [compost metagenome]
MLKLVMPALLLKDFLLLINIRLKDAIQINLHQIGKVLFIPARHWIHRLIRKRKCVQERLHRAFQ